MYPELIDSGTLPKDAAERAATILAGMQGGVGAYSGSKGVDSIRENVAAYIQERDGGELGDPENIFLTSGASEGIKTIMQLATRNASDGILIPTPQYPLYSATVTAIGGGTIRDLLLGLDGAGHAAVRTVATEEGRALTPPPRLGADTQAVLAALGLSSAEVDPLAGPGGGP
mgnify:CR=1 FL=1